MQIQKVWSWLRSNPFILAIAASLFGIGCLYGLVVPKLSSSIDSGTFRIVSYGVFSGGTGSAFMIQEPDLFVTNYHVIADSLALKLYYVEDGRVQFADGKLAWADPSRDLAIVRTQGAVPGQALELADIGADDLTKTDAVKAIGFPGAADQLAGIATQHEANEVALFDPTVSTGTIQRLVPGVVKLSIQHSADVSPGNSGGPLMDACDRVIGINTLSFASTIETQSIRDALNRNSGDVFFQANGSLESAVHVSELLHFIQGKDIRANISSGRCILGYPKRIWISSVIMGGLSIGLFLILGSTPSKNSGFSREPQNEIVFLGEAISEAGAHNGQQNLGWKLVRLSNREELHLNRYGATIHQTGLTIGRSASSVDIALDDPSISRRHACMKVLPSNQFVICDLGSSNGTRLDGVPVGRNFIPAKSGATITIGTCEFRLIYAKADSHDLPVYPSANKKISALTLSGFDQRGNTIRLFIDKSEVGRTRKNEYICKIGRSTNNNLVLSDSSVSRNHAEIRSGMDGKLTIQDLDSSNGTFVDGVAVKNRHVPIEGARLIKFGNIELKVTGNAWINVGKLEDEPQQSGKSKREFQQTRISKRSHKRKRFCG